MAVKRINTDPQQTGYAGPSYELPTKKEIAGQYSSIAAFPAVGEEGLTYIDLSDDTLYFWDVATSTYIPVSSSSTQVAADLAAEIARATAAEAALQTNINLKADQTALAAEITRAQTAEAALASTKADNTALAAEVARAQAAETALDAAKADKTALAAEVARATAAETALDAAKADKVALAAEVTRATTEESIITSNLNTHINNTSVHVTTTDKTNWNSKANQTDLLAEITRATTAENGIATNLSAEVTRAVAAETALQTGKMDKITGATGGKVALSQTNGNVSEGPAITDLAQKNDIARFMTLLTQPSTGGKIVVSQPTNGEVQESTTAISDLATAANLTAEITRATGVEAGLRASITSLQELGHFIGSVATYAALASFTLPAGATVNDYVTVQADETHGGQVANYVLTALGPPAVWTFDTLFSTDITGKMDKIVTPVGGKLTASNASGGVTETTINPADVTAAITQVPINTAAIAAEVTRAQAAETALQTDIDNEVTRAQTAEQALQNLINAINKGGNYQGTYSAVGSLPTTATIQTMDWAIVSGQPLGTGYIGAFAQIYRATNAAGVVTWTLEVSVPNYIGSYYPDATLPTLTSKESGCWAITRPSPGALTPTRANGMGTLNIWQVNTWTQTCNINMHCGGTLYGVYPVGTLVSALPVIAPATNPPIYVGDFCAILNDGLYQMSSVNSWTKLTTDAVSLKGIPIWGYMGSSNTGALSFQIISKNGLHTNIPTGALVHFEGNLTRTASTNGDNTMTPQQLVDHITADYLIGASSGYNDAASAVRLVGGAVPAAFQIITGMTAADDCITITRGQLTTNETLAFCGNIEIFTTAGVLSSDYFAIQVGGTSTNVKTLTPACTTDVNPAVGPTGDGTLLPARTAVGQLGLAAGTWGTAGVVTINKSTIVSTAKIGDFFYVINDDVTLATTYNCRTFYQIRADNGTTWSIEPYGQMLVDAQQRELNLGKVCGVFSAASALPSSVSAGTVTSWIHQNDLAWVGSGANMVLYRCNTVNATTGAIQWVRCTPPNMIKVFAPSSTTITVMFDTPPNATTVVSVSNWMVYDAVTGNAVTINSVTSTTDSIFTLSVTTSANVGVTYLGM